MNIGGDYGWGSDVLTFVEYPHVVTRVGSRLNFTSARELGAVVQHDVWELPSREAFLDCDFTHGAPVGWGPVVLLVLKEAGERFFACSGSQGLNCHDGQKVHVTVLPGACCAPNESARSLGLLIRAVRSCLTSIHTSTCSVAISRLPEFPAWWLLSVQMSAW